ncbi:IS110 family transposase [Ottowia testudinis]|uniref:IS110 family transposase n=1 Tax=Ottowia testudinis TaxID=2816950 RepID=A0A975CFR0_9BURK|nr:IS110 family transposase [Ottowia testudinis]QTD45608.1 IS110 family transposase [Ottowia testudinis]
MFSIGIDVAKAKLDVCVLFEQRSRTKVVPNSPAGFAQLLAWLQQHWPTQPLSGFHAILEGTGAYHEAAACALFDAGIRVSIVNPAQVRDFARGLGIRTKTDGVDSAVLARYGLLVQPAAWTPPPARVLQALLSRREAIAQDLRRERNRLEKQQAGQPVALVQSSLEDSIAFLQQQLKDIERQIDRHIDSHPDLKGDEQLLQSIPAVGEKVSTQMLSLLRSRSFDTAEQLAAYLGLVPVERQSGSSLLGRARLSKAGPAKLRATLYMAAVVGTRYNPHVKALYERLLANGKPKMAALGAAMRKLVHLCFGVWKHQQPYRADLVNAA